ATPWQLMQEVRFPLALPSILAGVNQTTMMALSMVVICSMVGAGGLGEEVLLAVNRIDVGRGFEAGWAIVVLAIIIDRLSQSSVNKWESPRS
ncbi:MAG TPA: choline ABC transporter permease subunit, partial [Syntrophomonas sp.]|nr:choline ABC transporter permease subunit [Syntrophomonas sp.]